MAGRFFAVKRVWAAGDCVELDLPMEFRFVQGRQRQYGLIAVLLGPLVYGLAPGNIHPVQNQATDQVEQEISPSSEPGRFAGWDGAAFSKIRLLPSSARLLPDHSIRILADLEPGNIGVRGDYELRLTRFPDPDVRCVYFHSGEPDKAVPDELLSGDASLPAGEIVHGSLPADF